MSQGFEALAVHARHLENDICVSLTSCVEYDEKGAPRDEAGRRFLFKICSGRAGRDSDRGGELREHAAEVLRVEGRHIEDHHGGDRHFDVGEEADLVRVVKGAGEARLESL